MVFLFSLLAERASREVGIFMAMVFSIDNLQKIVEILELIQHNSPDDYKGHGKLGLDPQHNSTDEFYEFPIE